MSTHYRVTHDGDWMIVALGGVLDFERAPGLRDLLMACVRQSRFIKVDLSKVEKIDTAGLASLIEAYRTATHNSGRFRLTGVVGQAARNVLRRASRHAVFRQMGPISADRPLQRQKWNKVIATMPDTSFCDW